MEYEYKKYNATITIPKDAFIDSKPINPNHPVSELIQQNINAEIVANFMGVEVVIRLSVYSPFLKRWMPIGPRHIRKSYR